MATKQHYCAGWSCKAHLRQHLRMVSNAYVTQPVWAFQACAVSRVLRIFTTGAALRNEARRGSSGAKEFAILKISSPRARDALRQFLYHRRLRTTPRPLHAFATQRSRFQSFRQFLVLA